MKSLTRILSVALLAVAVPGLAATNAAKPGPGATQSLDQLADSQNPIEYKSPEGRFQVTYPTGCARLRTRTNVRPGSPTEVAAEIFFVTCDRAKRDNEGCGVTSMPGAARGLKGQAAADKVLAEVTKQLEGYGVRPARQTPLRRDFGKKGVVEGLDIQAQKAGGAGDFWIRGLLRGEDIYLVMAWKASGGLWTDPEYVRFFDSFRPWAE